MSLSVLAFVSMLFWIFPTSTQARSFIVKNDESLWSIIHRETGCTGFDEKLRIDRVLKLNPQIVDTNLVKKGTVIQLGNIRYPIKNESCKRVLRVEDKK